MEKLKDKNNYTGGGEFWLFLISPVLGLYSAIINYKHVNLKNVLWIFNIFLGLTFFFREDNDAQRYITELEIISSFETFDKFFYSYLQSDGKFRIDFLQPTISFFVSRFSVDGRVLYAIYGLFFGFFYSRNIDLLIQKLNGSLRLEVKLFLIFFVCYLPFHQMNGFRFNIAIHIFIYGLLNFVLLNKKRLGLISILLTILFHDAFLIATGLFLVFLFLKKVQLSYHIIFYLYIISFFTSKLDLNLAGGYLESFEFVREDRLSYLNEEYVEVSKSEFSDTNFYIKYKGDLISILVIVSFTWIYTWFSRIVISNKEVIDFFKLTLIFLTFVNFAVSIPIIARFAMVAHLSFAAMMFLFFNANESIKFSSWFKLLAIPIISLTSIVSIWDGFSSWSLSTVFSNPLTFWFFDLDSSVSDFIKSIFK